MDRSETDAALHAAIEALQRLAELFEARREQLAREADLTMSQWRVLEEIASEDFMPSLFARRRDCSPAVVSRTLRQLQDRDLVASSIASGDRRQRDYALTTAGRRRLTRLRASRRRAIEAIWSDLPARDLERFAGFSSELSARLEQYLERGDAS